MCVSSFGLVIPAVNIKPNGKQCALTPSFVQELQTCVAGLFVTVCRSIPGKKRERERERKKAEFKSNGNLAKAFNSNEKHGTSSKEIFLNMRTTRKYSKQLSDH